MTMPADAAEIVRLAGCCEQATGPSRDIDALIAPLQGLRVVDEGHPLGRCCYDSNGRAVILPSYTASLDDAMSLVPGSEEYPDCKTFVLDCAGVTTVHMGASVAHVWGNTGKHTTKAATPALALTAAALRARAVQHEHEVG